MALQFISEKREDDFKEALRDIKMNFAGFSDYIQYSKWHYSNLKIMGLRVRGGHNMIWSRYSALLCYTTAKIHFKIRD